MFTAATLVLGMAGAGLVAAAPSLSMALFIGAYFTGRAITLSDFEAFSSYLFLLAVMGFVAGFF